MRRYQGFFFPLFFVSMHVDITVSMCVCVGMFVCVCVSVCAHERVNGQGDAGPDGVYVGCSTQKPRCHLGSVMRQGVVWLEQWGGYRNTKDLMSCECTLSSAYAAAVPR